MPLAGKKLLIIMGQKSANKNCIKKRIIVEGVKKQSNINFLME